MAVRLRDIVPQSRLLVVQGNEFPLYGLDLVQITRLIAKYQKQIETILKVTDSVQDLDYDLVMKTAPDLISEVIGFSLKMEDPEDLEAIKRLPPGVQLTALIDTWELTVPDPKQLAAPLRRMMREKAAAPVLNLETNPEKKLD